MSQYKEYLDKLSTPLHSNRYNIESLYDEDVPEHMNRIGIGGTGLHEMITYFIERSDSYMEDLENIVSLYTAEVMTIGEMLSINVPIAPDMIRLIYTLQTLNTRKDRTSVYDAMFILNRITGGISSKTYIARYMDRIGMILKVREDMDNYQLHELIVGLQVNTLLTDIANFPYTYGYSRVDNPVFRDNIYVGMGLSNKIQYNDRQVYIEYIENSISLADIDPSYTAIIIKSGEEVTITGDDLFQVAMLQIMCALQYAYDKIDFLHRDLNLGNILFVKLDDIQAIPVLIPLGEGRYEKRWIYSDLLVVIIDFGLSSVYNQQMYERFKQRIISPTVGVFWTYETMSYELELIDVLRGLYAKLRPPNRFEFNNIMYNLFMGVDPPPGPLNYLYRKNRSILSKLGYYSVHPDYSYFLEHTVSKFARKYSKIWTYSEQGKYISVIQKNTHLTNSVSIQDSRQYYLIKNFSNLTEYNIDYDSVIRNYWYRSNFTMKMGKPASVWYIKFYKWIMSCGLKLNLDPVKYNDPMVLLIQAYRLSGEPIVKGTKGKLLLDWLSSS